MGVKEILTKQGRHLVMRDRETGRIVRNDDGTQQRGLTPSARDSSLAAPNPDRKQDEQTWRRTLKRLTNDGKSLYERAFKIAMGEVIVPSSHYTDPTTGERVEYRGEPEVASLDLQARTIKDLHEMMHGKAVPETEVTAAEKEAEKQQALEAMTDEQLRAIINAPGNQTIDVTPTKKEEGE